MKTMRKRILSVFLTLCFCVLLIPVVYGAALGSADALIPEVRAKMIARETEIDLSFRVPAEEKAYYNDDFNAFYSAFFQALTDGVIVHDGTLKGGDYLNCHIDRIGGAVMCDSNWNCNVKLIVSYYTDAAQEAELDAALDQVFAEAEKTRGLSALSDYEKVRWAYDYICSHVVYDHKNLNDDSYQLKYSAYAALVNGTAVCQGYSNLFYLMLQRLGVDARIITGWGNGEAHAWNIVRLGEKYYLCDSTWDVGAKTYRYFLRGSKNFVNHKAEEKYTEAAFAATYPISETDYEIAHKHIPADMETIPATCTEAGSSGGVYCAVCGEILTHPTVIAALGHDMTGKTEIVKAATVTEAGTLRVWCVRCDHYEDRVINKLEPPEEPEDPAVRAPGDVDGDGDVKTADARLALRISIGLEPALTPDTPEYKAADVDGKPGVTTNDARSILRAAIGLEKLK